MANEADHISELLGDDHDLAVLRQLLADDPDRYGGECAEEGEVLVALIDRRRVELEQEAMLLGKRFFQEKPRLFARRLKGYWKMWRVQATAQPYSITPTSSGADLTSPVMDAILH